MKRMVKILTCFLAALLLAGCAQTSKPTIHGSGLFRGYNLDGAVDTATYIVYGRVVSKERPVELAFIYDKYGNVIQKAGCQKVTLEVIDCAKGGLEAGDKVSYYEMGGETRNAIYRYDGTTEVAKGENVFVFLGVDEEYEISPYVLTPEWIWILEDTDTPVGIEKKNLPEAMVSKVTKTEGYNEVADVSFTSLFEAARQMAEGTYVETMEEVEGEIDGEIEGDNIDEIDGEPEDDIIGDPADAPDDESADGVTGEAE